jgi:hypothetical protein
MKQREKVLLITDPICINEEHISFNRKLIEMFRAHATDFSWTGDKKYGANLFQNSPLISRDVLDYNPRFSLSEGIRRYRHIFKTIRQRSEAGCVVFLSTDNSLFPIFALINLITLRHRKVICIVHNNLYALHKSRFKRRMFNTMASLTGARFLVLTESMLTLSRGILKNVALLYHPFYRYPPSTKSGSHKTFLTLGRQGAQFYTSGMYHTFISACRNFIALNPQTQITLLFGLPGDVRLEPIDATNLRIIPRHGFIPHDEYERFLGSSNFFIFSEHEEVEFRASGTLIDTLSAGMAFIAPDRGHFREFGDSGILYASGEFEQAIGKALLITDQELETMRLKIASKKHTYEKRNADIIASMLTT